MRISNLTATAFAISLSAAGFLGMGVTAFASCGGNVCRTNTTNYGATTYGSTSYGSTSHGSTYGGSSYGASTANCPAGTRPSSDGTCLITGSGSSYSGTYGSGGTTRYASSTPTYTRPTTTIHSNSPPLASYSGQSTWTSRNTVTSLSRQDAAYRYGTGSISRSYSDGNTTIVPFSTSSNISSTRLAGMGANEYLTPTTCPVSVYNPTGAKVLGCYSVSKPAPVRVTIPSIHTVRVIRPIVYVRYPVPIAVPYPVYNTGYGYGYNYGRYHGACTAGYASRYGNNWPGRPCG
ncbi:MAG: hypothetical protein JKX72_10100 [Robiginitomaculum sp.]|nr:hypothetical protein [Robiginitomaculum sp.]